MAEQQPRLFLHNPAVFTLIADTFVDLDDHRKAWAALRALATIKDPLTFNEAYTLGLCVVGALGTGSLDQMGYEHGWFKATMQRAMAQALAGPSADLAQHQTTSLLMAMTAIMLVEAGETAEGIALIQSAIDRLDAGDSLRADLVRQQTTFSQRAAALDALARRFDNRQSVDANPFGLWGTSTAGEA